MLKEAHRTPNDNVYKSSLFQEEVMIKFSITVRIHFTAWVERSDAAGPCHFPSIRGRCMEHL